MNYIGIDCHITSLDFAVVNERGLITKTKTTDTSVKALIEFVKGVPAPRTIYIEEGSLANWLLEVCTEYGEQLIITDPRKNRWIGKSENKNDKIDAVKLAQLARGGYTKEIYHPVGNRRRFRELIFSYHDTIKSQTRIKNKIKSKFRENGIKCTGNTVYSQNRRDEWITKLPKEKILRLIVYGLWEQLDQIKTVRNSLLKNIKKFSSQYSEIKKFTEIPGIGVIHAATISAIIETPNRFANKKKVWKYAGLSLSERSSGDTVYSKHLSKNYNRLLKYSIKQAVQVATKAKDNQFRQQFLRLTIEKGIPPHRAKLTVSRSMLAVIYGMWKNGSDYDPEIAKKRSIIKSNKESVSNLLV